MRLFELQQMIDEGEKQDYAKEMLTKFEPLVTYNEQGVPDTRAFRKAVIDAIIDKFQMHDKGGSACNIYNGIFKTSPLHAKLSRQAVRAQQGKDPVKARVKGGAAMSTPTELSGTDTPQVSGDESNEDAIIKSIIADCDKLGGIDNPEGFTDKNDVDWDCSRIGDDLAIEWAYQYNHMSAVESMEENKNEVSGANSELAAIGQKYRDRVISYSPATMERAAKDDENFKGKPNTVRRLRGKLVLKFL